MYFLSERARRLLLSAVRSGEMVDREENRRLFADAGVDVSTAVLDAQAQFGGYSYAIGGLVEFEMGLWRGQQERPRVRDIVDEVAGVGVVFAFGRQADLQEEFWLDGLGRVFYGESLAYSSIGKKIEDDAMYFESESRRRGVVFLSCMLTQAKVEGLVHELGLSFVEEASDLGVGWWRGVGISLRSGAFGGEQFERRIVWIDVEDDERMREVRELVGGKD